MHMLQVFSDVHDCALEYLYSVLHFGEGDVIDRQQLEDGLKEIGALLHVSLLCCNQLCVLKRMERVDVVRTNNVCPVDYRYALVSVLIRLQCAIDW